MKTFVRDILNDLKRPKATKDFIPPVPKPSADGKSTTFDTPPQPAVPEDLNNQLLSPDPAQRVRQLDERAKNDENP